MQYKKTISVPAKTIEVVDRIECDFCGAQILEHQAEFAEVTICLAQGCRYGDSGYITRRIVDCCHQCWVAKVEPAIIALGGAFREEESDW